MFRASDIFGRTAGQSTKGATVPQPAGGAQKRPNLVTKSYDPATGQYVGEDLPADIRALMGKRLKTEVKEEISRKTPGKALGPAAVGLRAQAASRQRGPTADEIDLAAASVEFRGFSKVDLNDRYYEMSDMAVHGKPTYWSSDALFFVYWQGEVQRWSICDSTSLFAVRAGQYPGWAYKSDNKHICTPSGWMEAWNGEWREPSLEVVYRTTHAGSPAWEDKVMQKAVNTVEFSGFFMAELNTRYFLKAGEEIQGRESYWDDSGVYFIYWQAPMKRWAICDLKCYDAVMEGQCPGWAYRKDSLHFANACGWMERHQDEWTGALVESAVIASCEKGLKVQFDGFHKHELNTTYSERADEEVQGRATFWDPTDNFFVYWQKSMSRWAICDRASLTPAKQGLAPGWAYRTDSAHFTRSKGWMQVFGAGDWKHANVQCRIIDGKVKDDGCTMNAVKSEVGREDEGTTTRVEAAQYSMLIRKVYEQKNPAKVDDIDRLLEKHHGREHVLYRNVCEKYKVDPDAFAAQKVQNEHEDEGGGVPAEEEIAELPALSAQELSMLIQNVYMLHNPKKIRDIGALLSKYRNREAALYDEVCHKYGEHPAKFYAQHAEQLAQA